MIPTLAHGFFVQEPEWQMAIAIVMIAKISLYWLLVWAFRYRVSADRPMPRRRIALMVGTRAAMGPLVLLAAWASLFIKGGVLTYLALYVARAGAWLLVGRLMPVRWKGLVGLTMSGLWIDLALDLAVLTAGVGSQSGEDSVLLASGFGLLIAVIMLGPLFMALCSSSKSPGLLSRFSSTSVCRKCGYDLTGNTTGVCPECGTAIKAAGASERV